MLRARLGALTASAATAGSELQLADRAETPSRPTSPRPVRNGAFAFVAALFIAVLVALARERLAPRVADGRDLERLSGVPIVTEIPTAGRGAEGVVAEREAFDLLAAVVQAQLPLRRQKLLLVTSALHDRGKATVTAGLSRALAQSGEAALVVDADLRRPSLEQLFGMERAPGLAEILAAIRHGDTETAAGMIVEPPVSASSRRRTGSLAVLGAGEAASPSLVSPDALQGLVEQSAGGTDERAAFDIFAIARLLADQHHVGLLPAFSEHGLRSGFPKIAGLAAGGRELQLLQRRSRGDQRCGGLRLPKGHGGGRSIARPSPGSRPGAAASSPSSRARRRCTATSCRSGARRGRGAHRCADRRQYV